MLQALYPSKKELKASIGKPLMYCETSVFGEEYNRDGVNTLANVKRSWFAQVWMTDGLIVKVT
jgi:hypothetical protein